VGAGVANSVPGAVSVAFAGTAVLGMLAWWQVSQAVPEGTCAEAPAGLDGGMTTILLTPANVVTFGPWHSAQVVSPWWLIVEPVNFAPSLTGVAAMLEPEPTWQASQDRDVGRWFEGSPTIEKFAAGIAKDAAALPWHWAQLVDVLGAY
jgi:hypothetical protein